MAQQDKDHGHLAPRSTMENWHPNGGFMRLSDDERKLYNAVMDWLQSHASQDFDTDEQAQEYLLEQVGDWVHQWVRDSRQQGGVFG